MCRRTLSQSAAAGDGMTSLKAPAISSTLAVGAQSEQAQRIDVHHHTTTCAEETARVIARQKGMNTQPMLTPRAPHGAVPLRRFAASARVCARVQLDP